MKKEDLIFALYKDKIVTCKAFKNICREKYGLENVGDLYVRLNNYQIEKYGVQLCYENETKEDWKINNKKGNLRDQNKKKYYKGRRIKYENK